MPRPNILDVLEACREPLHRCDFREIRNLIHHALYYHNNKWLVLPEKELRVMLDTLATMRRMDDAYYAQFSTPHLYYDDDPYERAE